MRYKYLSKLLLDLQLCLTMPVQLLTLCGPSTILAAAEAGLRRMRNVLMSRKNVGVLVDKVEYCVLLAADVSRGSVCKLM